MFPTDTESSEALAQLSLDELDAVVGGAKAPTDPATAAVQAILEFYARQLSHIT